jgi:F-type H+-transporting ATPase subunit b
MLSFAILIWFSVQFIWPHINKAIEERQLKIAEGLDAAERARAELREKVGALAVQGAAKIVQREIDPAAHKALLDQLATEI